MCHSGGRGAPRDPFAVTAASLIVGVAQNVGRHSLGGIATLVPAPCRWAASGGDCGKPGSARAERVVGEQRRREDTP
ncbi:hypothetical protein Stube_08440 [Streptomyces tubercidicus]|uniref:Uncharacterized protein n=1 Tax=Streptomyces tubercidicus TaxID=47759 RepID=A0A640UNE4_9ACTN|nr:hypothetical protein Stube_08440 [Streptomyces tubercidicus]